MSKGSYFGLKLKPIKDWLQLFLHNCIAHPMMCFLPRSIGDSFHDWTIPSSWKEEGHLDFEDADTDSMEI